MKIFITGATGFIGTHLVNKLSRTNHELFCLVRKSSNINKLRNLNCNINIGDVTNKNSILKGMKGCDWIIHLANVYSFWEADKHIFREINVNGTRNVMECALETNVLKVIHISTVAVYGKPSDCPFNEESQVGPTRFSEYARTKYEGELIAWDLHKKKGLPLVVIYPGIVLGPGDYKPSGQYIKSILSHKMPATAFHDSVLTFVHVNDVATAIINALEKQQNIGQKYFVAKHQLSMYKFNKMISDISNISLPKINLPNSLSKYLAVILTGIAYLIKKPPLFGMAKEQIKTMEMGCIVNGSKVERDLDITYTSIYTTLEEAILS